MNIQERYLYSLGLSGKHIEWGSYLLVTSLTIEVAALLLLDSSEFRSVHDLFHEQPLITTPHIYEGVSTSSCVDF